MSYCRFSSDDFQCDVYCYADVAGGYTTHVANNRVVFTEPLPPVERLPKNPTEADIKKWIERDQEISNRLDGDKVVRVQITLPFAGETFNDATLEEFKARLLQLKGLGYNVPDYALERIDEEIEEEKKGG